MQLSLVGDSNNKHIKLLTIHTHTHTHNGTCDKDLRKQGAAIIAD